MSLTLISGGEGREGGRLTPANPHTDTHPARPHPPVPLPSLRPVTRDKVSSRLTGRRGGWPFWIWPASRAETSAGREMGQLSSADPRGDAPHLFINGGGRRAQHGEDGVSRGDQQSRSGTDSRRDRQPAGPPPPPPMRGGAKTICKHLAAADEARLNKNKTPRSRSSVHQAIVVTKSQQKCLLDREKKRFNFICAVCSQSKGTFFM